MPWAPDYTTPTALKAFLRVADTVDDAVITAAITAASRSIDEATGRQFGVTAGVEARYFTPRYDRARGRWVVDVDDFQTAAGLLVAVDTADDATYGDLVDEYALWPVNAAAKGEPWRRIVVHPTSSVQPVQRDDAVEVTATWGWTAVPSTIVTATQMQASRLVSRRDSPYGIAGSPEAGSELRLLDKLDPDVAVMIKPYTRVVWAR